LDLGLQQKETARLLDVHPGGLENWEYGRTAPADRFMPAVIRFLGYNPAPSPNTMGERVAYERNCPGVVPETIG
jgi:transcriptional regulator with XRE-family HTH domain